MTPLRTLPTFTLVIEVVYASLIAFLLFFFAFRLESESESEEEELEPEELEELDESCLRLPLRPLEAVGVLGTGVGACDPPSSNGAGSSV